MKKTFVFLVLLLFLSVFVSGQTTINPQPSVQSQVSIFEKTVVKEHFLTRTELKSHMDQKALEFQAYAKAEIQDAFDSLTLWVSALMNKFVFKLVMAIIGSMLFAQSIWYFLKRKLDTRFQAILDMRKQIKQEKKFDKQELKDEKVLQKENDKLKAKMLKLEKKAHKKGFKREEIIVKPKLVNVEKSSENGSIKPEVKVIDPSIIPEPPSNMVSDDFKDFQEYKNWKKDRK